MHLCIGESAMAALRGTGAKHIGAVRKLRCVAVNAIIVAVATIVTVTVAVAATVACAAAAAAHAVIAVIINIAVLLVAPVRCYVLCGQRRHCAAGSWLAGCIRPDFAGDKRRAANARVAASAAVFALAVPDLAFLA